MKWKDLFVPRWQHSNPEVRQKVVNRLKDPDVLRHIIDKDEDEMVRLAAKERLTAISSEKVTVDA